MRTVKKIAKRLKESSIDEESKSVFMGLIHALDEHEKMDISRIFNLNYSDFELAMKLLLDWRLHQYIKTAGGLTQALKESSVENNQFH